MQQACLKSRYLLFGLLLLSFFLNSCQEDQLIGEVLVYDNDFSEVGSLTNIENGRIHVFENDSILGNYNNEETIIKLGNLPGHNTVRVVIELMIHDSWDGNSGGVGGPDYWYLNVDGKQILNTTFSNTPCVSTYCLYQSYPDQYGRHYDPKTGAIDTDLPGLCQYKDTPGWTSKYRISKLISHVGPSLSIICGDQLVQDNVPSHICDESWSISKIEVSTLSIK
ncbi:hypothetical protein KZP23_05080 [Echinicola marina]|uniref:hypothetical protein n=1 Tax=Echinicola marina TaxID=2859768 RepID=UPI001CF6820B|nr:hypothetical protein [Echinicola marina]UCS94402.1 hypothetical protein KZP23_05080 [Echinicola marina]